MLNLSGRVVAEYKPRSLGGEIKLYWQPVYSSGAEAKKKHSANPRVEPLGAASCRRGAFGPPRRSLCFLSSTPPHPDPPPFSLSVFLAISCSSRRPPPVTSEPSAGSSRWPVSQKSVDKLPQQWTLCCASLCCLFISFTDF